MSVANDLVQQLPFVDGRVAQGTNYSFYTSARNAACLGSLNAYFMDDVAGSLLPWPHQRSFSDQIACIEFWFCTSARSEHVHNRDRDSLGMQPRPRGSAETGSAGRNCRMIGNN